MVRKKINRIGLYLRGDIHQSYFVVAFAIGIIVGTIIGLVFRVNYFSSPIWCGVVIALLAIVYLKPKLIFAILALIAGLLVVFFRMSYELKGENYISQLVGQNVVVSGTIDGDPDNDDGITKIKLTNLRFGENKEYAKAGNIYVSLNNNEELMWGDNVTLKGKLLNGFGTYAGYLYKPSLVNWQRPEPGNFVLGIRNWFSERIRKLVPKPEVNLGLSYLLGMRAGLSDDLSNSLRVVGLTHIVVASGAHLSILVEIAKKVFGKISRFAGLLFSVIFVVFFMSMVGWTPSILRAGIMTILSLFAWYVGRKFEAWRIILIVMAITLMINPMFLISLGWLMSFASFGGIMILGPKLSKLFYGTKKPGFIGSMIITTISASLMTLPITLYYYGQLSLISAIANLLILPTLPYAMGLTFFVGVFAGIMGLENIVSFFAMMILDFHIIVVEFFGGMRSFMIEIEPYQIWTLMIYIAIAFLLIIAFFRKRFLRKNMI